MYQEITLVGNAGRDPELRHTPDGTPVTDFSMATNRRWTSADGSKGEETVWWKITAWRGLAEIVAEYIKKGNMVFVVGRVVPDKETGRPRIWTTRDGEPRASFEINADTVRNLGRRDMGDSSPRSSGGGSYEEEGPAQSEIGSDDDKIPF